VFRQFDVVGSRRASDCGKAFLKRDDIGLPELLRSQGLPSRAAIGALAVGALDWLAIA